MPRLKFIIMCGTIRSLKSIYAGSFIFDLHRKFLFLDFVARKRNIFSRPEMRPACCNQQYSMMWFDSNEAV